VNLKLREYGQEERFAAAFSPLRLSYDTVVRRSVAESASQAEGFLGRGHTAVYPPHTSWRSAGNARTPQTASSVYNEVVISAAGDYEPA
jgi:hypothetical protein